MRAIAATVRSFRAPSRWNKTPSVCLFNSFRLPSAANLRRFSSADSATGGADFKRPSERKLSEKLTEGVRLRFYTYKQCFELQRCDLLLPSAFGSHLPLRGRSFLIIQQRARDARPYNVAKKASAYCTVVPVGARIARPHFAQNVDIYKMTTAMWADCPIK